MISNNIQRLSGILGFADEALYECEKSSDSSDSRESLSDMSVIDLRQIISLNNSPAHSNQSENGSFIGEHVFAGLNDLDIMNSILFIY